MSEPFSREGLASWLSDQYLRALLAGDAADADRVVAEAIGAGMRPADLYALVITPAMYAIGELWARGDIGVADEHLATSITTRVVALAAHAADVADERRRARVLVATVEGEAHVLGAQMVAALLEEAGYEVLMLGGDLPAAALVDAVEVRRPQVIALSATMPDRRGVLAATVAHLRAFDRRLCVVVGGAAADPLPGMPDPGVQASDLAHVIEAADALRRRPGLN